MQKGILSTNSLAAALAAALQAEVMAAAPEAFVFEVIAGRAGEAAYVDHAISSEARFKYPAGVAVDAAGNIVVVDLAAHAVRRIKAAGGVETIAGSGSPGFADGLGSAALFDQPQSAALDGAGNIYITDRRNAALRRISPEGATLTLAGGGGAGAVDGTGPDARFHWPFGLAFGTGGDLFLTDLYVHNIRRVTSGAVTTTFAGPSTPVSGQADGAASDARFNAPFALAAGPNGFLYVTDADNSVIRGISPEGVVSTLAGMPGQPGQSDGIGSAARFAYPRALAWDGADHLYVADAAGLRRVGFDGTVATMNSFEKETGGQIRFTAVEGMAFDTAGRLVLADGGNRVVRRGAPSPMLSLERLENSGWRVSAAGSAASHWWEFTDSLSPANWQPVADSQAAAPPGALLVSPDVAVKERYFRARTAE
jgi:DNA-binding beta-propeller fold protein YncE